MIANRRGFTLVEVLAAMLLIAIVLPIAMKGITLAASAGTESRRRSEAAGLAQSKLGELIATGDWETGNQSGTFAPNWPDYRWEAGVVAWSTSSSGQSSTSLQQVDVRVLWTARTREDSITLSTLVRSAP